MCNPCSPLHMPLKNDSPTEPAEFTTATGPDEALHKMARTAAVTLNPWLSRASRSKHCYVHGAQGAGRAVWCVVCAEHRVQGIVHNTECVVA